MSDPLRSATIFFVDFKPLGGVVFTPCTFLVISMCDISRDKPEKNRAPELLLFGCAGCVRGEYFSPVLVVLWKQCLTPCCLYAEGNLRESILDVF